MSAPKAFEQWIRHRYDLDITHEKDCRHAGRSIPIDECMCNCYVRAIFTAGYRAAKGEAQNHPRSDA